MARPTSNWEWEKLRKKVFERDGYMCIFCGRAEEDGVRLHCDHIVRDTDGGSSTMDNLQTLCHECHKAKSRSEQSTKRPYVPTPTRDW